MDFSNYLESLERPVKPKRPFSGNQPTIAQAQAYIKSCEGYDALLEAYQIAWAVYKKREAAVLARFKQDALLEVGLSNHRNADKIYAYAWDETDSCGLEDVFAALQDLAELAF